MLLVVLTVSINVFVGLKRHSKAKSRILYSNQTIGMAITTSCNMPAYTVEKKW